MLNFEFRGVGKRCSVSDRILLPGEEFYSALVEGDEDNQRLDFAVEHWKGPPENCIGWWKSEVPSQPSGRVYWAPREVLLAFFEHILQQPNQADTAYITALLLAQKKILATKETLEQPDPDLLYLENKRDKASYQIPVVQVSPDRMMEIQLELSEKLFTSHQEAEEAEEESK